MWSFSFFVGNFLGPTLSGIFVDKFNFESVTLFFFGIYCAMIIMDSLELWYTYNIGRKAAKPGYETVE